MIERMCKISCAVPASLARAFFEFLQEDGRTHLVFSTAPQSDEMTDKIVALRDRLHSARNALEKLGRPDEAKDASGAKTFSCPLPERFEDLVPEIERIVVRHESELAGMIAKREKLAEEKALLDLFLLPLNGTTPCAEGANEVLLYFVPQDVWPLASREIEKQCGEAVKFHATTQGAKPVARRRGFRARRKAAKEISVKEETDVLVEFSAPAALVATVEEILSEAGARPWTPPQQYRTVTEAAEAGDAADDAATGRINSGVNGWEKTVRDRGKKRSVTANAQSIEDEATRLNPTEAASRHLKNEEKGGKKRSVTESVKLMRDRAAELDTLLAREREAGEELRRRDEPLLDYYFKLVDKKVSQYEALSRCERLGGAVIVRGWIPESAKENFISRVDEKFSDTVALFARDPEEDEYSQVPSAISNGKFFSPFEIFLKLVQPPAYASADPTSLIGVFFPFFSGCIIGDAGYGLVMLVLMILLRKRSKNKIVRDVAFVLENVCVWSLFWGVAFGEFFGDTAHRLWGVHPLWVERSEAVMPVLLFSVALGFAHVLIGMVIGLVQGLRGRHKKHAVEKLGGILVIVAMLVALLSVRQLLPHPAFPVSIVALVLGLILLAVGGGIGGLIEPMTAFGHILSYVRIGAIGLSSAILAVAASKFVDVLGLSALGIFIALSIHLLNFVLAFAESGLHAARLHYVEFMGNFYEAKGTDYKPFVYKER